MVAWGLRGGGRGAARRGRRRRGRAGIGWCAARLRGCGCAGGAACVGQPLWRGGWAWRAWGRARGWRREGEERRWNGRSTALRPPALLKVQPCRGRLDGGGKRTGRRWRGQIALPVGVHWWHHPPCTCTCTSVWPPNFARTAHSLLRTLAACCLCTTLANLPVACSGTLRRRALSVLRLQARRCVLCGDRRRSAPPVLTAAAAIGHGGASAPILEFCKVCALQWSAGAAGLAGRRQLGPEGVGASSPDPPRAPLSRARDTLFFARSTPRLVGSNLPIVPLPRHPFPVQRVCVRGQRFLRRFPLPSPARRT